MQALRLSSCTGETRQGLGIILKIMCDYCGLTNDVPCGSRHSSGPGTPPKIWDINSKAAAGNYDKFELLKQINVTGQLMM